MQLMEKTFTTPQGTIHYWTKQVDETVPWLVMLPGLTADHRLFERQLAVLGQRYHCLVWDAPAHGASRPFALAFSMADMADWLWAILSAEGITRPVLVGQSMGGYVAQSLIARHPGTVRGFISVDSAPLDRSYYTAVELAMLRHTHGLYLSIPWRWLMKMGARGCAETTYGRTLMAEMMATYDKWSYCALAAHGYRILAEAVEADTAYFIDCPTLLLCGERDQAGSCRRYSRSWATRAGHPLVWVPRAGHNSNTDRPAFVNREIEAFVQRLGK